MNGSWFRLAPAKGRRPWREYFLRKLTNSALPLSSKAEKRYGSDERQMNNAAQEENSTISDEYREQLKRSHEENPNWGTTAIRYYDNLLKMINYFKADSVLDYGCGKGVMGKKFREDQAAPDFPFKDVKFYEYDPGIPEKMHDQSRADIVICIDVIEHIEPDFLDTVLADIERRMLKAAFLLISCVPAVHRLPDGRNAHLIIEHPTWWLAKLEEHFDVFMQEYWSAANLPSGDLRVVVKKKQDPAVTTKEPENKGGKKPGPDQKSINKARELIKKEKYTQARTLLLKIEKGDRNPDVLFELGRICQATNDTTRAAQYFLQSGQYNKSAQAYKMAGIALTKIESYENALKCLELDECQKQFMDDADYREAFMIALTKTHKPDITARLYESRSDNTCAHAVQYVDALIMLQNLDDAKNAAIKATEDYPDKADAWSALERAWTALRKFDEALEASQKALDLDPENAACNCNLGLCYLARADTEKALRYFNRATELDPMMMAPYLNRSTIYKYNGEYGELKADLDKALELDPSSPDLHYAVGVNAYRQEDYDTAFAEIEWYWHKSKLTSARMPLSMPRWYGEDIKGKTLMIFADQGVGDIIMMMRYIPLVVERYEPKKIILNIQKKMNDIALTSFAALFESGKLELLEETRNIINTRIDTQVDLVVAAATLPHAMGETIDTIPQSAGYLKPATPLDYKTGTDKDLVIGISWYTKSLDAGFIRSLSLTDFSFLKDYENIRVLDLQYGDTSKERADAAKDHGFEVYHDDTVDSWVEMQPFLDQIAACDLVISIDNVTVHAAGALGKPCWVILPQESYWRWPIAGEATPWYDSLRLFRQIKGESYTDLFVKIEDALKKFVGGDTSVLAPPKFQRLFPKKEEPARRALILNDTQTCFTWGHNASMNGLKKALKGNGFDVKGTSPLELGGIMPRLPQLQDFDDPKFLSACRYRDPTLFHTLEKADTVIINGDGMMNSMSDTALQLLYLAYVAKHVYGLRVGIINHSCYPEGGPNLTDPRILAFYHKVYTILDFCTVRDDISFKLLRDIGANVEQGLDTCLFWLRDRLETTPAPEKTKTAIITAGPGYDSHAAQTLADLCTKLSKQGLTPILLHGAQWHTAQEDRTLKADLEELAGNVVRDIAVGSPEEFADCLGKAAVVISGFYQTCLMAHALGVPVIPVTTGSNAVTLTGLSAITTIPAPLFYEDPALGTKLEKSVKAALSGPGLSATDKESLRKSLYTLADTNLRATDAITGKKQA